MARIRTIKPEAFVSESLASVSLTAERTFFGLLTQADDQGRHRDHPAIIHGLLWPLRPEHTPLGVEEDLLQLQQAGLICRYTGCDGRAYLHVTSWKQHQKIDRPSVSRNPACPVHEAEGHCGGCKQPVCAALPPPVDAAPPSTDAAGPDELRAPAPGRSGEGSTNLPAPDSSDHLSEPPKPAVPETVAGLEKNLPGLAEQTVAAHGDKKPGQHDLATDASNHRRGLVEDSASGSRIKDPGSSPQGGADAPPRDPTARKLIAEYVAACPSRPPRNVLGHLGRQVTDLLAEGIDPEHVRAGLERFRAKPLSPSILPSMVNEAMNAPSPGTTGAGGRYRAWTNPDDASAYAEEL